MNDLHPFKLIRGKALFKSIASTAKQYASIKVRMHNDACSAVIMAAEHGNTDCLNGMFEYLPKAYQNALREWCGEQSAFLDTAENGETRELTWLGFKKEKGFHVKAGKRYADARQAWAEQWAGVKGGNLTQFFANKDKDAGPDPIDVWKLINSVLTKVHKHQEEPVDGDVMPPEVVSKLEELAALKPVNTLAA